MGKWKDLNILGWKSLNNIYMLIIPKLIYKYNVIQKKFQLDFYVLYKLTVKSI